ncbi:hypothetical protein [Methylomarinovum tepidoasis]|uniref:hypothetical protein n=1 Tax=Methylomarinovum tepidoasis TaxID=2840183 RepID=UPI002572EF98|nr:hypothetical protein [Methylomarinovum sp. IN45]
MAHYVLVYPDLRTARVWRLRDGRFVKRADAVNETLDFDLAGDCRIAFDFSRIWP